MSILLPYLALVALAGAFGFFVWYVVADWRDNRRWRQRARERGQPLCKRCRLPEDHWDHGSYGDCCFVEADHG